MGKKKRVAFGVTLPPQLLGRLDTLRNRNSKDKELAGRNRGEVIEILVREALQARRQQALSRA